MKKYIITEDDYIKAVKRADREQEIAKHGKVISLQPAKVHTSKKAYNRAKTKFNFINIQDYESNTNGI